MDVYDIVKGVSSTECSTDDAYMPNVAAPGHL